MPPTEQRHDVGPILAAAREWIDRCLVADGSLFGGESLWTTERIAEVRSAFVDHPDEGDRNFITKLRGQMAPCSGSGQRLMAEMLWALLLFPSSVSEKTKRLHIAELWTLSGAALPEGHELLSTPVLQGIGSGGPGYNNHRWRELVFLFDLCSSIKILTPQDRRATFNDYDTFMGWIASVPQDGHRQFRHMLRYLCFPDRVEPMSSNGERYAVLEALRGIPRNELTHWSDSRLDEALHDLRRELETQNPGIIVDFYMEPFKSRWKKPRSTPARGAPKPPAPSEDDELEPELPDEIEAHAPTNVIAYGPPGTGKTYWLQQQFERYTSTSAEASEDTWQANVLDATGWRCVIVAAMADIGRPVRVPEIRAHRWVQTKLELRRRKRAFAQDPINGFLIEHTPESNEFVRSATRRPPFVFERLASSSWQLLSDWQDVDTESAGLYRDLTRAGPATGESVQRYEVVTFHPSFTYEDFVRGIRPVPVDESGTTQFRFVDGVFKRICDRAHADPLNRYALFIDEINRANIAKVFGELITLIEPDKRARFDDQGRLVQGMAVRLPGAFDDVREQLFGVPPNLDIYGTMNTADRSIAMLDIALRRRFRFEARDPDYTVLDRTVEGVHLGLLLQRVNNRLEYLLDRDHQIGHAYLMTVDTLDELRDVFGDHLVPLLHEYFYDDASRVAMLLSTVGQPPMLVCERLSAATLFPVWQDGAAAEERERYAVTPRASWTAATFRGIYEAAARVTPVADN